MKLTILLLAIICGHMAIAQTDADFQARGVVTPTKEQIQKWIDAIAGKYENITIPGPAIRQSLVRLNFYNDGMVDVTEKYSIPSNGSYLTSEKTTRKTFIVSDLETSIKVLEIQLDPSFGHLKNSAVQTKILNQFREMKSKDYELVVHCGEGFGMKCFFLKGRELVEYSYNNMSLGGVYRKKSWW